MPFLLFQMCQQQSRTNVLKNLLGICSGGCISLIACTGQSAFVGICKAFQNSCSFGQPNRICAVVSSGAWQASHTVSLTMFFFIKFVLHLILSWESSQAKNFALGRAMFFQTKVVQASGVECSLLRALYSMVVSRSPVVFIIGLRLWSFPSVST